MLTPDDIRSLVDRLSFLPVVEKRHLMLFGIDSRIAGSIPQYPDQISQTFADLSTLSVYPKELKQWLQNGRLLLPPGHPEREAIERAIKQCASPPPTNRLPYM